MCRVAFCLFLAVSLLSAGSNTRPSSHSVTVLLQFDQSHSDSPVRALQTELQRILADEYIDVDVQTTDNLPVHPQFHTLLVFKMKGQCSMNAEPVASSPANGEALASTYEVNGEMLPFADVQCDRVRGSLQQVFGSGDLHAHQNDL